MNFRSLLIISAVLLSGCPTSAENKQSAEEVPSKTCEVQFLAWNIESGGNDSTVIAAQLQAFLEFDIVGLSEVADKNFERYRSALGERFTFVGGQNRYQDHLQLLFDQQRFELIRNFELDRYGDIQLNDGNHRSPLAVHLKEKSSDLEFIVVLNHLARGSDLMRTNQAIALREWARDQTLPLICIGDFNFDYDFHTKSGNEAFVAFLRDNIWQWVVPDPLIDTNWSDRDGKDKYPDSMLDFMFVAGPATEWSLRSEVIVREGDFPDNDQTSDHRPVSLTLDFQKYPKD
ncbi:MAG: hypothetical protein AAFN77_03095 [Planctomycetota bacterium]